MKSPCQNQSLQNKDHRLQHQTDSQNGISICRIQIQHSVTYSLSSIPIFACAKLKVGCAQQLRRTDHPYFGYKLEQKTILCCIVVILLSTDAAARLRARRALQRWYLKIQDLLFQMLCKSFTYHVQFRKYRLMKLSPSFLITLYLNEVRILSVVQSLLLIFISST